MALHQRGKEVDTSQTFPPPTAVGNNDVVTGQRLSIVATSADHSAAAAASVGDNGDYDDEANKLLPRAGMDADGGGRVGELANSVSDTNALRRKSALNRRRPPPPKNVGQLIYEYVDRLRYIH